MMSNNSSLSHRREKNKSDSSSKHKQSGKNPKISSPNTKIPNSDLEHAIIQYLQNHQEPQRTIAISKAVGGGTSKFVNPSLYKLMGERILHQTNKQPPLWALNPTHTAMNHRFNSHYSMPHHNHFNGFQSRGFDPQSVVYESQHTFEVQNYFRDQGRSFSPQNQRYQFPSHASCERMQSSNLVGSQTGGAHRYPSYHGNTQRRGHSSRTWKNIGEQRRVHTPHPEMYKINNHSGRIHDTAQRSADQLLKNTIKDRDQEMRKINKHNDSIHDTAQGSADELFKNTIKDKDAPGAYKKTSSNQASLTNSSARNTALVSNTPTASTQDYIPTSSLSDKDNQQPGGNNSSQNAGNASFDSESEEDDLQYRVSDVMNSLPRPVDLDDGSDYESDSEYEDMDEDWGGSDEVTAFSALGDEAEEQWAGYGPTTSSNDAVVKDEPASTYSPIEKNKIVRPPSPAQLLQAKTNFNAAENAPKENSRNESTGFTDTISTSLMPWLKVNLSSMPQPVPISATTSLPRTQPESLTLGQQLLKEGKTCVEGMEYLVLSDETEMQAPPSQQQRRPPLLSTPLVRGSNPSPSLYSPSFGYRFPFQPVSQEQPSTNSPTQPSLNNEQNESLPAQPKLQITAESFAALNKNPISAFMEYAQSRHLAATIDPIDQQGPSHKPVFVYAAKLGNRIFPYISSNNKKDGKKEAAEQAIRILIAEGQYHLPQQISIMKMPESSMTDHDKIAAKVHQTYNQLIATVPESFPGRKVIAGMVMEIDSIDSSQVVSIGSGNRCITGDKLSQEGNTVNDCHAEIIARRGLMSFLWDQVISYSANQKSSILEFSPATGKLRVKSDVKFHLYISTAPCGDGALFSPRDVKSNNSPLTDGSVHHPVYTNNAHGVLRTKMEGGEGTIPIESSYKEQAWDGLITGERLRTMSCSDKICRWNVLGMQGALLGHFLDPIYLASITLGYLYDHSHLCRAVCCRLDRENQSINEQLPRPYHLNHPVLGRVTACDPPRETQKTKSYSVNWRLGEDRPEVLDGSLGICYSALEKNMFSRLSKKNLFDKFKRACAVHKRSDLPMGATYYTTKRANTSFLQAKEAMFRKFKSTGCGKWISKPQEEEMFS